MATGSTLGAVATSMVASLAAALPGVQVSDGRPADGMLNRESVWVGDATGTHDLPVMKAGRKPRDERYELELWVWVVKPRGTLAEVRQRAVVLWNAAGDTLANDPGLANLDGILWAKLGHFELRADFAKEGPWAALRSVIDIAARLA